ncbi:hypothetical protein [Pseudonocardia sp. GCM10023141]|uniref:hypothetical protein n=1 Tax=Pseudonocardia sp. GCM10023141 TaxID=3252653 RepID=UPI00360874F5
MDLENDADGSGAVLASDTHVVLWMLGAFVVTFAITRAITHLIRRGRGPFRDMSVGGVHLHHQVFGIFLLLGAGTVEFAYRPGSPWLEVLAVLFGVGAALTLDEFALWLRLDDVYWGPEGRRSVDAVLLAVLVGVMMLLGLSPFDQDTSDGEVVLGISIAVNVVFVLGAILKGRTVLAVTGLFVPLVAFVAVCRLARPGSMWARRWYAEGSRRRSRSRRRFPEGRRERWDALVDLFAGKPAAIDSATTAPPPPPGEETSRRTPA